MNVTIECQISVEEYAIATVSLSDECNNGYDSFGYCCDVYHRKGHRCEDKIKKGGKSYWLTSIDNSKELMSKHFSQLLPVRKLSGCDVFGVTDYPMLNGMYHLEEDINKGAEYLRISLKQAKELVKLKPLAYFEYIKTLIAGQYKIESSTAIALIEKLSGQSYTVKDKVSPTLYNDIHYTLVTKEKGWNVYKNSNSINEYLIK